MLRSGRTLLRVVTSCASQRVALLFLSGPRRLVCLVGKQFICLSLFKEKTILYIGNHLRKISILCSHKVSRLQTCTFSYASPSQQICNAQLKKAQIMHVIIFSKTSSNLALSGL